MPEINWKHIIRTIKAGKCILFIGPEVSTDDAGVPLCEIMLNELDPEKNENIVKYYDKEDFFLFADDNAKSYAYYDIADFYEKNNKPCNYYKQIARFPFSLIININPDMHLSRVYAKNGFQHQSYTYNKKEAVEQTISPSKENPVIYNLFGTYENLDSMILTHEDLFDFLESTLSTNKLPSEIRSTLLSAHNYIFLGFRFDKWYVQFLIRLLQLPKDKTSFSNKISLEAKTFFIEQFNINFPEYSIADFLIDLESKCLEANIGLRTLLENENELSSKVKYFITQNKIAEALDVVMEVNNSNEMILLKGRFNELIQTFRDNRIEYREYTVELAKIKYAILNFMAEI